MVLGESLTSHNRASYICCLEPVSESGEQKHYHGVGGEGGMGREIGP